MSTDSIVRDEDAEEAEIFIRLENENSLTIRVHPERRTLAFLQINGPIPATAKKFQSAFPLEIVIVPTLSTFEPKEIWVTPETAKKNEPTRLASRNFRNIWLRKSPAQFDSFNSLIREGWPHISVESPTSGGLDRILSMCFVERGKRRELQSAGFGLQVWLQMMAHIMRGSMDAVLVLDEPDIYLHPDLQRKLYRIIKGRFGQVFLATHSTEIINEVNAGDILSIESGLRNARRVTTDEGYQRLFEYLGSSENSEFARMARARRIVFFEGEDRRLLRRFAQKTAKAKLLEDPDTVFLKTGGFGQWKRVTEVAWTLENVFGMRIKIAALFDRDYRCSEEVEGFLTKFAGPDIFCRVLKRKEIENYALNEAALTRTIIKRAGSVNKLITVIEATEMLDKILDEMHDDVRANILGDFVRYHKGVNTKWSDPTAIARGMEVFEPDWANRHRRFEMVGGKEFISILSRTLQERVGASVTIAQIIQEMHVSEIPQDLDELIASMEAFFSLQVAATRLAEGD